MGISELKFKTPRPPAGWTHLQREKNLQFGLKISENTPGYPPTACLVELAR